MPAAFFGHGNPMNALEVNRYTTAWQALRARRCRARARSWWSARTGTSTPPPSPRCRGRGPSTTSTASRRRCSTCSTPRPDCPSWPTEVSDVVHPTWVGADVDSWGIDHGTWSVLVHAFPDASIPVVQLSINADKPLDYHLELGAKLAPLRRARRAHRRPAATSCTTCAAMDWKLADDGYDWAQRFDEDAQERACSTDPTEFATLDAHRDFGHAVPTPDHFIPALYLAGLAGASAEPGHRRPRRRLRLRVAVDDGVHARPVLPGRGRRRRMPRSRRPSLPPDASNI